MMRHGVTVRGLLVVVGVLLVLGFLVATVITRGGSLLPVPPWPADLLLVVMGGLVLWVARPVRRHLASGRRTAVDGLRAARTVVLAQASALTGAAAAGWYLGHLLQLLTDLDLVANRDRLLPFGAAVLASALLAVAGMVAQSWCRIDEDEDDPRFDERPTGR
ncbi:DUF3180 domain-containing protein [Phycicoccus sp. BSK3Z-2]|uniref:DUF3180 domain-containing protein n=1 Tax=Phycicoccus avicenniae TaxID=2828860 RepID=A0A941D7R5_9MICO|nr:DUF3180 domain-containing protein [Phycicoccus avicenniae]MBR7743338.1 DUF3180 domain-containing protein [Phycicoccus avicenniae]